MLRKRSITLCMLADLDGIYFKLQEKSCRVLPPQDQNALLVPKLPGQLHRFLTKERQRIDKNLEPIHQNLDPLRED